MRNAVFVHGKPPRERYENPSEPKPHAANWFPWITEQLVEQNIAVAVPEMPKPYFPVFDDWKEVFEQHSIGPQTALVGHSAGAEFILRWLSQNEHATAERVVLLAPYKDYDGKYNGFSDYQLDTELVERVGKLTILHSSDDDTPIIRRSYELAEQLTGAQHNVLRGYGHFRIGHNMTSPALPPLLVALQEK